MASGSQNPWQDNWPEAVLWTTVTAESQESNLT